MSETTTATPAPAFDPATSESISDYRAARETLSAGAEPETSAETPAPAATATPAPAETPAETEPDPASDAGKALAAKKGSLQARINDLTREKHETRRQAEAAQAEAAELRRQLAALQRPAEPKPAADQTPLTGPKPKLEDFQDYEAFIEALTEWKTDEKLARQAQASAQDAATREADTIKAAYRTRAQAFAQTAPDFDAVLAAADLVLPAPIAEAVFRSESGPALSYYLATHPDEARALVAQPPLQALVSLGKIEATLSSSLSVHPAASSGPAEKDVSVSAAPEPIKPVGSGGAGASTAEPSDINSVRDFRAWKKRQGIEA